MILLIACGVVLVVSVVGARMYILFKEKTINKHRYDNWAFGTDMKKLTWAIVLFEIGFLVAIGIYYILFIA